MLRHGRVAHNPFVPSGRPYCLQCRDEVEVDIEGHHDGARLMYREICRRCGKVVSFGAMNNVPMIGGEAEWLGLYGALAPDIITTEVEVDG